MAKFLAISNVSLLKFKLNKYLLNPKDENMKKLQLEDIYKLKNAISQDKASIEFVFKLCQQYETSKQALNKLKNDGINL